MYLCLVLAHITGSIIQWHFFFQLSDDVVVKAVHSTTSESAFIESGSGSGSASGRNSGYPSPDEHDSNEEQLHAGKGDSDEQPVLQESEDADDYRTNEKNQE